MLRGEKAVIPNEANKMVLEGKGKFFNRPTKTAGKTYDKFFIYVPTEVARDSAFPLKAGCEVEIKVEGTIVHITSV